MLTTYEEALTWITRKMPQHGMKPGLERMNVLLERLGRPDRRLKFIHVAGTNGKGSTCAFLDSVLRAAGYDVGMFTSPFIEKYTSRIQYNGESLPEDTMLGLVNRLLPVAVEMEREYGPLSMFELTTALAILYFATVAYPDYVVWETGLGGRLDCTNAVVPVITVITNVGLDHTDVLGETIAEIAAEKAGIIKSGVPVVTAADAPEALEVIRRTASGKKAKLYTLNEEFHYRTKEMQEGQQSFDFEGLFRNVPNVEITLNGQHQQTNAAVALMTLEVLRQYYALVIDDEDLYTGMKQASWIGRLELLDGTPRLLLDGAHNPDGAKALVGALQEIFTYEKLIFVLAMVRNKNHREYLRHILPIVDTLIVTEPEFFKAMPAAELHEAVEAEKRKSGVQAMPALEPDWKAAIEQAKRTAGPNDLIVLSGSLYFLSDARSWLLNQTDSEKGW